MPSYEELCQRFDLFFSRNLVLPFPRSYQETLALCSSSQSLFDLFSVEPITSSLESSPKDDAQDHSDESSEEELFYDSPVSVYERKRKIHFPPITEQSYKGLLAQHKRERKLRRLSKVLCAFVEVLFTDFAFVIRIQKNYVPRESMRHLLG